MAVTILEGDCRERMRTLPPESVHCVITSPPYFGLRSYGTEPQVWGGEPDCPHEWASRRYYREGGNSSSSKAAFHEPGEANAARLKEARWRETTLCSRCGAWRGELGGEPSIDLYLRNLVSVFSEVWRVLRVDGTLWLNMGDCYESGTRSTRDYSPRTKHGYWNNPAVDKRVSAGLRPKNLLLLPHRLAIALQDSGWVVRQDICWFKPNPLPESVRDRPTRAHEYLFLLSKSYRYYYDREAIREEAAPQSLRRITQPNFAQQTGGPKDYRNGINPNRSMRKTLENFAANPGRNKRSVWTVNTKGYPGAHFATFPPALIEPCVLAGCPVEGTVLDPFAGSGTTGEVALKLGRGAVLIELNPEYCDQIRKRLQKVQPPLVREQ